MVGNVHRILRFTFYQLHHQPILLSYGSTCPSGVEAHLIGCITMTSLLPDTPRALLPPFNTQTFFTALAPLCLPHWHHASPLRILLHVKYLSRYMGMLFSSLCVKDARGLRVCFALAEEFVVVDSWMTSGIPGFAMEHYKALYSTVAPYHGSLVI